MIDFAARPNDERMALRQQIEDAGGEVEGYYGPAVQVAEPTDPAFRRAMRAAGWTMGGAFYFPLGSDAAPDHLRHDGRYPGSRGFWLYGTWTPPAGEIGQRTP